MMSILLLLTIAAGNALALLLDMTALLLMVRIICRWRPVAVLTEFDHAGKPLVDRTLRCARGIWERGCPERPLGTKGQLLVAWAMLCVMRLGVSVLLGAIL